MSPRRAGVPLRLPLLALVVTLAVAVRASPDPYGWLHKVDRGQSDDAARDAMQRLQSFAFSNSFDTNELPAFPPAFAALLLHPKFDLSNSALGSLLKASAFVSQVFATTKAFNADEHLTALAARRVGALSRDRKPAESSDGGVQTQMRTVCGLGLLLSSVRCSDPFVVCSLDEMLALPKFRPFLSMWYSAQLTLGSALADRRAHANMAALLARHEWWSQGLDERMHELYYLASYVSSNRSHEAAFKRHVNALLRGGAFDRAQSGTPFAVPRLPVSLGEQQRLYEAVSALPEDLGTGGVPRSFPVGQGGKVHTVLSVCIVPLYPN